METVNIIWEPSSWQVIEEELNKDDLNDILYKVMIGIGEEDSLYEIYELISKTNYDKILNKTYKIEKFPYSKNKILLFDEDNCLIPLVKTNNIIKEELSTYQKEIVNKNYINLDKKKIKRK